MSFDQEIFGQLVQPQQIQNRQAKIQRSQKSIIFCLLKKTNNLHSNLQLKLKNRINQQIQGQQRQKSQQDKSTFNANLSAYEKLSSKSTQIGNERSGYSSSIFSKDERLEQNQFKCIKCLNEQSRNQCVVCKGTGRISGSHNFVKFLQYLIQFKIGLKEAYKPKQLLIESVGEKARVSCSKVFSFSQKPVSNKISYREYKSQILSNRKVHYNYKCDECKVMPIVGVRYHCKHPQCQDDYDICQNCFCRVDHAHDMQQISENGMSKNIQMLQPLMQKKNAKERANNFPLYYSQFN